MRRCAEVSAVDRVETELRTVDALIAPQFLALHVRSSAAPVSIDTKCCAREEERGELTRCERAQERGERSAPAPAHEDRSARRARSRLSKPSTT